MLIRLVGTGLLFAARAVGDQLTVGASKDNTLYESATGSLSNGAGNTFFAGQNDNDLTRLILSLEEEMHEAAKELRFEYAARLRDEVNELKRELRQMTQAVS